MMAKLGRTKIILPASWVRIIFVLLRFMKYFIFPHLCDLISDVITIEKTGEFFRLLYDVKGRFTIHRITAEEAKYKLCRVKRVQTGPKGIPFCVTNDGRTIRYPDPLIKVNDTVQLDIATGKITDFIKFDSGSYLIYL